MDAKGSCGVRNPGPNELSVTKVSSDLKCLKLRCALARGLLNILKGIRSDMRADPTTSERRTGRERRRIFHLGRVFYKETERRDQPERRSQLERRDGWVRINKWSSVYLWDLKIAKFLR
jgi:hypothetical protein